MDLDGFGGGEFFMDKYQGGFIQYDQAEPMQYYKKKSLNKLPYICLIPAKKWIIQ